MSLLYQKGQAATNATLAWLGGGSLAAGGGGMALGTLVLGAAALGVGLLAGGFILSSQGDKALEEANTLLEEVLENEKKQTKFVNF